MNIRQTTARVASLFAALMTTAVVIGSQLGLVDSYTQQADLVTAAKRAAVTAQAAGKIWRAERAS